MKLILNIIDLIRWYLAGLRSKIGAIHKLKKIEKSNKKWIFSRTSCFGNEVLLKLNLNFEIYNIQKGRIDFLGNKISVINSFWDLNPIFVNYFRRKFVLPLITNQNIHIWKKIHAPEYVILDSYSELSDFLFVKKRNRNIKFLANYFDITHDSNFKSTFDNMGLIKVEDLTQNYKSFFLYIRDLFGDMPIIFLHIPRQLEKRREFLSRSKAIKEAIDLIKGEFENLHVFEVSTNLLNYLPANVPLPIDPYHFNEEVYLDVVSKLLNKNILK